jgi:hypothetical protein
MQVFTLALALHIPISVVSGVNIYWGRDGFGLLIV